MKDDPAAIAEHTASEWAEPKKPKTYRTSDRRREFSMQLRIAIVNRASDGFYNIHCEKCGIFCKSRKDYQIDHIIPEAERPAADKAKKLVSADGQLLCLACHGSKTKKDVSTIALVARQMARNLGVEKANKRRIRSRAKAPKAPYEPASGEPRIAREYGSPAGSFSRSDRDGAA
jgi:5-methylcytosine-specific restriction endonuclease McrA